MEQIPEPYSGGPDKTGSFLKLLGLIFLKQGFWSSIDQSESGIFHVAPHLFLSEFCHLSTGLEIYSSDLLR